MAFPLLLPVGVAAASFVLYYVARAIDRIYFHPLAAFPGPWHAKFSDIWFTYAWMCGRMPFMMQKVHAKYGDVVRIGPNELSFATAVAFNDVYGHASKGRRPFLKSNFYDTEEPFSNIVTERKTPEHQRQRRMLSNAFSAKSLRDQEDVVHEYVDAFIQQIGKIGAAGGPGINVEDAFIWVTFDIIGDLAFGESFDCCKTGKTHFWIQLILDAAYINSLAWLRQRMPVVNAILPFLVPKDAEKSFKQHSELTREKARKRIELGPAGKKGDFFSHILQKGAENITQGEIMSQASALIVAGSETTATTLTHLTYQLLNNRHVLDKLTAEVRSAFTSYSNITGDSTAHLPYLHAVIEEGLRLLPPVPPGLMRESPGAQVAGWYVPEGTSVRVETFTAHHDPRYWRDPDAFKPERWLGEGFGDNKDVFNPFSRGPRACIGINLAYLELRVIISKMLWTYDLEWVNTDLDFFKEARMPLLWYKPPVFVRYRPRADVKAAEKILVDVP